METSVGLPNMLQKVLLTCGIFAALLKVGTDVLAGMKWKDYNFISRSISELSAIGSPTRALVVPLDLLYFVLMIAFSAGMWQMAGQNILMHIAAGLIAGNAVISSFVSLFLPMRIGQDAGASASTIHVVLMATGVLFFLLAMGFAGAANRNWFRYYSFGTLLAYLVLALAGFLIPSQTSAGLPVSTVGAQERTMVLGYLLWVAASAVQLLTKPGG
jgi:hypothetical protein